MASAKSPPTLVFIVGPPAVGKMTVGYELAQRTGLKVFHNHHTNTELSAAEVAERVIARFGLAVIAQEG